MQKLTDEQKAKFGPMLCRTWEAIASDAQELLSSGRSRLAEIVELTCDANRPEMYGGMSSEEYKQLSLAYGHPDTKRWLRKTLNY